MERNKGTQLVFALYIISGFNHENNKPVRATYFEKKT